MIARKCERAQKILCANAQSSRACAISRTRKDRARARNARDIFRSILFLFVYCCNCYVQFKCCNCYVFQNNLFKLWLQLGLEFQQKMIIMKRRFLGRYLIRPYAPYLNTWSISLFGKSNFCDIFVT